MPDSFRLEQFGLFCQRKKGVNGPDIHMKAAGAGTEGLDFETRSWRLAVYNNFCSTPSAAVVWATWSWEDMHNGSVNDESLEDWIRRNWKGIPIRQNRRPARSVPKLTRSLDTLCLWMRDDFPSLPEMSYAEAWKSLDSVYTWGRYVKIKWLETCRRFLGPDYAHFEAPDIHGSGGWSPRKALGILYPEYAMVVANKARNDKQTLNFVHSLAQELRAYVSENWVETSTYELEALLCNYRQTLSTGKTFYAGRTIDSELEYHKKIINFWGDNPYLGTFNFFSSRLKAFPIETLGEIQGWDGVRADLSPLLREDNIVWSDAVFSYNASKDDLSHPKTWEELGEFARLES